MLLLAPNGWKWFFFFEQLPMPIPSSVNIYVSIFPNWHMWMVEFFEDNPNFTIVYKHATSKGTYNFFSELLNWYGILLWFWGDFELRPSWIHPHCLSGEKNWRNKWTTNQGFLCPPSSQSSMCHQPGEAKSTSPKWVKLCLVSPSISFARHLHVE
jgi:hypothetical protein